MKKVIILIIVFLQINFAFAQLNMSLLGTFPYSGVGRASDIWGYVDENGNEYALMGMETGVSIVDVTNPTLPNEVFWTPGVQTIWRDLKTFNDKVYITNEAGNGIMIIDMSPLPASTLLPVTYYTGSTYPFQKAHNLFIDENGYCYVFGADNINGIGGAIILNLNLPTTDPNFEVGQYNDYYLHDGMVRGDTLWGGAVYDGFFTVVDVSDKSNPVTLVTKTTPSNFTHNTWISDDGQTLVTTDEKSNGYLAAYDVSDLGNITETDRIQSSPGEGVIPHNVHFKDNFIVTSYYTDGVTIHDVSNPNVMVEVGNYDTSPAFSGDGFNGCWGVYPWLPSGNIIASDVQNGLIILGASYTGASYLKGKVTNLNTAANLDGVQIEILTTSVSLNTNVIGDYSTGIAIAGNYDVIFSKAGFYTDTIFNVVLQSGITNLLNVQLEPFPEFIFSGKVLEEGTLTPIANAQVHVFDSVSDIMVITDALGNFAINNLLLGEYSVTVGDWGHRTYCDNYLTLNDTLNYTVTMEKGYYDDFSLDFNWSVSGNATSGVWERGEPKGSVLGVNIIAPEEDVDSDCNDQAFITGNQGVNPGDDDLANGSSILTSPVFDASWYANPRVSYSQWFYNKFGSAQDDVMIMKLNNGVTEVVIDQTTANSVGNSTWAPKSFLISNYIAVTNNMTFIVEIGDLGVLNITEGGLDKFEIVDQPLSISENIEIVDFDIYPNPFKNEINIKIKDSSLSKVDITVVDVVGKLIDSYSFNNEQQIKLVNNYQKGVYMINIYSNGELLKAQKIIKN